MKRYGNLYSSIISLDNLILADEKARKGKTNKYGVKVHDKRREENIQNLHLALKNKTYKTSEYNIFTIYEPKERQIYRLPYYPDRIVHHAIMNILEPIFISTFTYNTYSCIKKRGIEGCAKRVDKIIYSYRKSPNLYCLKIDIKKCYPSINHDVLKTIVRKKLKDPELLWLLDEIIDSASGLPIGNYLSQFLCNLYFSYFMHWVNEELHKELNIDTPFYATEYADDFVVFSDNKENLHKAFELIEKYINQNLKLQLKENWQIFKISNNKRDKSGRALDYVGYKFYRKQKLLRNSIKYNLKKRCEELNKNNSISYEAYKIGIASWIGWVKHSNSKHLLKTCMKNDEYYYILVKESDLYNNKLKISIAYEKN